MEDLRSHALLLEGADEEGLKKKMAKAMMIVVLADILLVFVAQNDPRTVIIITKLDRVTDSKSTHTEYTPNLLTQISKRPYEQSPTGRG
jgi:hypothetical protein